MISPASYAIVIVIAVRGLILYPEPAVILSVAFAAFLLPMVFERLAVKRIPAFGTICFGVQLFLMLGLFFAVSIRGTILYTEGAADALENGNGDGFHFRIESVSGREKT